MPTCGRASGVFGILTASAVWFGAVVLAGRPVSGQTATSFDPPAVLCSPGDLSPDLSLPPPQAAMVRASTAATAGAARRVLRVRNAEVMVPSMKEPRR